MARASRFRADQRSGGWSCAEGQAARLDPDDPKWPYARGLIALKRDPDNALPLLRQAAAGISRPDYRAVANLQLAEALLERERLDEAEVLFRAEFQGAPDKARAA